MMLCAGRKTLAKFEFVKFVELATQLMKNLACLGRDFMLFEVFNESFAGMFFHANTRERVILNAYLLGNLGVKFYVYH